MPEYFYIREIVDGDYNIENPKRVDEYGNHIYLANEVSQAIPNEDFQLFCAGSEAKFIFENELTQYQKDQLDETVYKHKHNL